MKRRMRSAWELQAAKGLFVGARIANARGTPGTLGCFALTLDDRKPVLLTSEHVLFGAGGREQEPVSLVNGAPTRVARARHGRRGVVRHASNDVYVDCATAELDAVDAGWSFEPEAAGPPASAGDTVVLGRIAHSLKSSSATVGATALAEHCRRIENAVRLGNCLAWPQEIDQAQATYAATLKLLREECERVAA